MTSFLSDLIGMAIIAAIATPPLLLMYAIANACFDEIEDRAKEKRS